MKRTSWCGLTMVLLAGGAAAQQSTQPASGTRDLPFFRPAPKEELPPLKKTTPVATTKGGSPATNAVTPSRPAKDMATLHLGLRYSLLLDHNGRDERVDPDRQFRDGDCFALELESNRSAYLYVFVKQASGGWEPLIPSAKLGNERNVIDPGQPMRTPKEACIEVRNPPGTDTLFVVISRDPREVNDLQEAIRGRFEKQQAVQMANNERLKSAVDKMDEQFGTRDLDIRKGQGPATAPSREQSVYVVNGSNKATATLVTKIDISHR